MTGAFSSINFLPLTFPPAVILWPRRAFSRLSRFHHAARVALRGGGRFLSLNCPDPSDPRLPSYNWCLQLGGRATFGQHSLSPAFMDVALIPPASAFHRALMQRLRCQFFLPSSLHAAAGLPPLIITSLYVPPTVHRFSTSLPENEMKRAPAALFIIFHPRIRPSCGDATTYSSDSSSQWGSLQTPDQGEAAESFF